MSLTIGSSNCFCLSLILFSLFITTVAVPLSAFLRIISLLLTLISSLRARRCTDLKHLNQALVLLYYYKNSPPISKSWIRAWRGVVEVGAWNFQSVYQSVARPKSRWFEARLISLCIVVLFPETRRTSPHQLSSPRARSFKSLLTLIHD